MLTPGIVLNNRYRVESYLEQSDVGEVYLAADLSTQEPVTLKVLRAELAENAAFLREFRREVPALAALDHPNIARFYALEQVGALAFTVAEYVPGTTLQRRLMDAGGYLPAGEATQIAQQVADALTYAHHQGIVHGDLRPGSIVLNNGTAMVEDFGFGAAMQVAPGGHALLGNPYASPEQQQGQHPSAQSDVWGLAALLFAMVTGQPFTPDQAWLQPSKAPFRIDAPDQALLNRAVGPAAAAVIVQGLSVQPSDRQPDADVLVHEWLQALPRRSAAATPAVAAVPAAAAVTRGAGAPAPAPAAATVSRHSTSSTTALPAAPRRSRWLVGGTLLAAGLLLAVAAAWLALSRLSSQDRTAAWAAGNFTSTETPGTGLLAQLLNRTPAAATPTPGAARATATPPSGPFVIVRVAANLREGPGTGFATVGGASPGTRFAITGRNEAGDWWQVCCVNNTSAWIFADLVSTGGPTAGVRVVQGAAPPSPTPTATSLPPTQTPVPPTQTAVPPTATDTPRPNPTQAPAETPNTSAGNPASCAVPPAGSFARLSSAVFAAAGCPVNALVETHFSHQYFEHGQMIYRYDLRSIYVLYDDGTWASYPDPYVEGQPLQQQELQPPDGLKQPIKGFDRVWERPEVRDRLGWATRDEMGVIAGQAQALQRASALWLDNASYLVKYFILLADGRWGQS